MRRWLPGGLPLTALLAGCEARELQNVADAYLPGRPVAEQAMFLADLERVMPFYVVGTLFAGLLLAAAVLNGLEHARNMGRDESIRYGAFLGLLCFVGLFMAMAFPPGWLPPGHPVLAVAITGGVSAAGTALAAKIDPKRAVLRTGYWAAALGLPLFGVLFNRDVYLIDTTASLFIGQASGLLLVIVLSAPLRAGLVEFLSRRDAERRG